jgi:hypothetical protein
MNAQLFVWLIICHWLADWTHLSTPWMLAAKKYGTPLFPIAVHAAVHAILMGTVLIVGFGLHGGRLAGLVLFQLATHTAMDWFKGYSASLFRGSLDNPACKSFWWMMGADQLVHILVIFQMSLWAAQR